MDLRSKVLQALSTLTTGPSTASSISTAIRRATEPRDTPLDDHHVHGLLFLVSNSPSSSTFLARRLSLRISTCPDHLSALKALLLLHRLLRGGDRRFELDIRDLHASGDLRFHVHHHDSGFIRYYAEFMSERTSWAIDQSGRLEPVGPAPVPCRSSNPFGLVLWRLLRCQDFIDRVVGAGGRISPDRLFRADSRAGRVATIVVLKESFRVYATFQDGMDLVLATLSNPTTRICKSDAGVVREIIRRSSSQSHMLSEFYETCKVVNGFKDMEFPDVKIITTINTSALEKMLNTSSSRGSSPAMSAVGEDGRDHWKLETRISTEWVKFDAHQ